MKLDFDSELRDTVLRLLTHRPIPMAQIEDIVNTLRALKPMQTPEPQDEPEQSRRADSPRPPAKRSRRAALKGG